MNEMPSTFSGTATAPSVADQKWGSVIKGGYQLVPDLLLKNQKTLEIGPTELVVLLNILMHWWYPDQKPYPRSTTIAKRMGVTVRTIQRAVTALKDAKLDVRERGPTEATFVNPAPLVKRLLELAQADPDYLVRTGQAMWRSSTG